MDAKKKAAAVAIAASIAAGAEGLYQKFYYDPVGILTVCYGHTGDVKKDKVYSRAECEALLTSDMQKAITIVDQCVPGLPDKVLAAFGDAVFNMGPTIACDTRRSMAANYLKNRDLVAACNQLPRWDKARVGGVMVALPGLTKRRAKERDLCLQGAK